MLKNAKKVEADYVRPHINEITEEFQLIPSIPLDEYETSIRGKFNSFQRKLDDNFNEKFGKAYHEFRLAEWNKLNRARAVPEDSHFPGKDTIKGRNFSFDERFVTSGKPEGTIVVDEMEISLPDPYFRELNVNLWDEMQLVSQSTYHFIPDAFRDGELGYTRNLKLSNIRVYVSEFEELRNLYKTFWYANQCRDRWVEAYYDFTQRTDECILNYCARRYVPPDGLNRADEYVLSSFEGETIATHIDDWYEWIVWTRDVLPWRTYKIGEPGDQLLFVTAIYLLHKGVSKYHIKEKLNVSMVADEFNTTRQTLEKLVKKKPSFIVPEEELDFILGEFAVNTSLQQASSFDEPVDPVPLDNIKLSTEMLSFDSLAEYQDSEGTMVDSLDEPIINDIPDIHVEDTDLPYRADLFYEEFDPTYNGGGEDPTEYLIQSGAMSPRINPGEHHVVLEDIPPEDKIEQEPDALERLGNDLVDPRSYSTILNPTQRTIDRIWRPSGPPKSLDPSFRRAKIWKPP